MNPHAAAAADRSSVGVIDVGDVWTSEVINRWLDRAMIMAAMSKTNSSMQDRPRKKSVLNVGCIQANSDWGLTPSVSTPLASASSSPLALSLSQI